ASCKAPVKRLWISSLTDESIREGFTQLKPAEQFDNLYLAGLSRAIGDWILGMNATRLYTLKYAQSRNVLSIGRVQTPTLALIVARQSEIDNFIPQDYWEIKTTYRGGTFNSTKGRYDTEDEAQAIVDSIANVPLEITNIEKKKGREAPPRLFDLTSLQVECNKKWGYGAELTLKLIQSLYEKKVTTYPRVDTTYLSDDIYPKVPGILQAMTPYAALTAPLMQGKLPKSKKVFDNSKVTDHHAIIPTNVPPQNANLTHDEKLVYNLIAKRFIAAFYPDCEFDATTVMAKADKVEFKATGKKITKEGWKAVYARDNAAETEKNTESTEENDAMPEFIKGESGPHKPELLKKTTQPPKPYTEGTLLRAMETAGKLVDDEALREAMKENGIGRPSTRAAIIETLLKRHYIMHQRKNLVPTPAGKLLVATIKDELLKSAKLTGIWENKLRQIERGEYSPQQFINELKTMIGEIVLNVLRDNNATRIITESEKKPEAPAKKKSAPRKPAVKTIEEIICPQCGEGHLLKGKAAFGCSRYASGCNFLLPFDSQGVSPDIKPAHLAKLVTKLKNAK
ncbi:MAG: DNA topoisomerase III, partial [Muribaculaceae bacterium]|nr:DNA topoisomerase III [Muribaculaceae bacterium]